MHSDGAGAPFPLRSEVVDKAAWLDLGRAVQVDPIKLTLKAPGTKRLKR